MQVQMQQLYRPSYVGPDRRVVELVPNHSTPRLLGVLVGAAALVAALAYRFPLADGSPELMSTSGTIEALTVATLIMSIGLLRTLFRTTRHPVHTRVGVLLGLVLVFFVAAIVGRGSLAIGLADQIMVISKLALACAALELVIEPATRRSTIVLRYSLAAAFAFLATAVLLDAGSLELGIGGVLAIASSLVAVKALRRKQLPLLLTTLVLVVVASVSSEFWLWRAMSGEVFSQKLLMTVLMTSVLVGVAYSLRDANIRATLDASDARRNAMISLDELERKRADREVLVHDARNALLAIHGGLRGIEGDEQMQSIITSIDAELDRLQAMIEHETPANLGFDIDRVLQPMVTCYRSAGINLRTSIPAGPPAWGRPTHVVQIVQNLVENAIRHGGGGVVDLVVDRTDETVRIAVCDRGPGFGGRPTEELFQPGVSTGSGSGLGLSNARKLAAEMQASMTAHQRPDGGAIFALTLASNPNDTDVPASTIEHVRNTR